MSEAFSPGNAADRGHIQPYEASKAVDVDAEIPKIRIQYTEDDDLPLQGEGARPYDKRIRSLLKKLRDIYELKMKEAGGTKLEEDQTERIATEKAVREGLAALGFPAEDLIELCLVFARSISRVPQQSVNRARNGRGSPPDQK